MTEFNEEDLRYVSSLYDKDRFDTRKAIARFNEKASNEPNHRRWWTTAAAVAASAAIAFAAGWGIVSAIKDHQPAVTNQEIVILNPDVAVTHKFVYEDVPIADVLKELSEYYHCTLKAKPSDKHLTATFPDDDVDFIVSLIEKALDIEITIEK